MKALYSAILLLALCVFHVMHRRFRTALASSASILLGNHWKNISQWLGSIFFFFLLLWPQRFSFFSRGWADFYSMLNSKFYFYRWFDAELNTERCDLHCYFIFIHVKYVCVCVCDIATFAVCTCMMKVREMIYFYTVFMQMSIEAKLTIRR